MEEHTAKHHVQMGPLSDKVENARDVTAQRAEAGELQRVFRVQCETISKNHQKAMQSATDSTLLLSSAQPPLRPRYLQMCYLLVCVYVCVCVSVHMCTHTHGCTLLCICTWRAEINVTGLSHSLSTSFF